MQADKIIGIDIGGTKIQIGLIQAGQIINQVKLTTSAQAAQNQILDDIIAGIKQLIDDSVVGIGIGAPGLIDEEAGIIYQVQNIPSWEKVPIKQYLESHFAKPVYITNDANCFVLGEKLYGQAQSYKNVIGLTLGTGLGGGIIANNNLYSGTLSSAGEFGGIPYLNKTYEDYCSGKFFQQQYGLEGTEVLALATKGDAHGLAIYNQFGRHLGEVVKFILYAFSPEAIFLGGSVSNGFPFFKAALELSLEDFPFKTVLNKLVIAPCAIDHVAVLGAGALCQLRLAQKAELEEAIS